MKLLQAFRNSISFITIIPAGWSEDASFELTVALFPAVGLFLGFALFLLSLLPKAVYPPACLAFWVVVTGAFHLDGLADSFDALAVGKGPEERLKILKDSHLGTFGAVALIVVLSSKLWLMAHTAPHRLILPPVLGRYSLFLVPFFSKPARKEGLGHMVKEATTFKGFAISSLVSLAVSFLFGWLGLLAFVFTVAFSFLFARFWEGKIGGITGDTLGASCEIVETVVLALVTAL